MSAGYTVLPYTGRYMRLHIPTNKLTEGEQQFFSRAELQQSIARWNGMEPGVWQYWEKIG